MTNSIYEQFLNKKVRIIITTPGGVTISYSGKLLRIEDDGFLLEDRKLGIIVISKKDVSQVVPEVQ